MGQTFTIRIAGVTHKNPDGTDRQSLLRRCRAGERVRLRRERDNPYDPDAIAVETTSGKCLGYVPAGDRLLANHIDRGGEVHAEIELITGGPTLWQRLLRRPGKHYGCVLCITKGNFDWSAVEPWRKTDRQIDTLIKEAKRLEKDAPDVAISNYREAIEQIMELDSQGEQAAAWRTAKYPADRLSLMLDRQRRPQEAIEEIERWRGYADPVGIPDSQRQSIEKREARLRKRASVQ